jgi:hypothetical protein
MPQDPTITIAPIGAADRDERHNECLQLRAVSTINKLPYEIHVAILEQLLAVGEMDFIHRAALGSRESLFAEAARRVMPYLLAVTVASQIWAADSLLILRQVARCRIAILEGMMPRLRPLYVRARFQCLVWVARVLRSDTPNPPQKHAAAPHTERTEG